MAASSSPLLSLIRRCTYHLDAENLLGGCRRHDSQVMNGWLFMGREIKSLAWENLMEVEEL